MRNIYYLLLSLFSGMTRKFFKRNLRVLAYHGIPDATAFVKQIEYLKSHYNLISINDLKDFLFRKKSLPKYPLLLTFDDGDRSILEKGLPILKQAEVTACVFIISGYINTKRDFWWGQISEYEQKKGNSFKKIRQKINSLKQVSNIERIKELKKYPPNEKMQLTSKDLKFLEANGLFIGNHSHNHPMFDKCSIKEIQLELDSTKRLFAKWNIKGHDVLAYPNGNRDGVSEEILIKNGVQLGFLFDHNLNSSDIHPLRISRIRTNADMPIHELMVKASGLHSVITRIKAKI